MFKSVFISLLLLDLLFDVSTQTGVVLDTTFTVKALRGLLEEMKKNPGRFKGGNA